MNPSSHFVSSSAAKASSSSNSEASLIGEAASAPDEPELHAPDADADAPLPKPVHEFIVNVADRGPSTRLLASVSVLGVALFALSIFALPHKAPPSESPTAASAALSTPAAVSAVSASAVTTPAQVDAVALVPQPLSKVTSVTSVEPATQRAPEFAPALATVSAAPLAADTPRPEKSAKVVNAPGVPDTPRAELLPVGATSAPASEIVVVQSTAPRERESAPLTPVLREEGPAAKPAAEPRSESPATE